MLAKLGLSNDMTFKQKQQYKSMPQMFMHGTRSPVFVYMKHLKKMGLTEAIYSTGTLYEKYIFPMTGAMGGEIYSERENVGLKVVSGIINTSLEALDRNVFYTTFSDQQQINLQSITGDLEEMLEKKAQYYSSTRIFGLISRMRYWDDTIYKTQFQQRISQIILPVIQSKRNQLQTLKQKQILDQAVQNVIFAEEPVIQFTLQDKHDLQNTFPVIFCSAKAAQNSFKPKENKMFEPDEMYVDKIDMQHVDYIYTTSQGYKYVQQQTQAQVIVSDELFFESDRLTPNVGQLKEKGWKEKEDQERLLWNQWNDAVPFWINKIGIMQRLVTSGIHVQDFAYTSLDEIEEVLNDILHNLEFSITRDQLQYILDKANLMSLFYAHTQIIKK
jgi:hypothetical protein